MTDASVASTRIRFWGTRGSIAVPGPETLRQLASFSERQIEKGTGVHRDTIRLIRHGKGVKRSTYAKLVNFLKENSGRVHGARVHPSE